METANDAPRVKGQTETVTGEVVNETEMTPWRYFEEQEEKMLVAELNGVNMNMLAYSFNQDGKSVGGISYKGILTLQNKYGGIESFVGSVDVVRENNVPGYRAKVFAVDHFNLIKTDSEFFQPMDFFSKSGKKISDRYARQKAISKARRNAVSQLLPQQAIFEIQELAAQDKTEIGAADVERILIPFMKSRKIKQEKYFERMLDRQFAGALPVNTPNNAPALPENTAPDSPDDSENTNTPENSNGGDNGGIPASKKQKNYIYRMLKDKCNMDKEQAIEYIETYCTTSPDASDAIKMLKADDTKHADAWLAKKLKKESTPQPDENGEFEF